MVNWKNKEEVKEYKKRYKQTEKYKKYHREYMRNYSKNPQAKEKVKKHHEEYYKRPEVIVRVKEYNQGYYKRPENKEKRNKSSKQYRQKYPEKIKARNIVTHKKLRKDHCELCAWLKNLNRLYGIDVKQYLGDETTLEGHHPDYSKPKEIVTLCLQHHTEIGNQMNI